MKPAMIMHLTMVVVADASFGRGRFRSEPFLRRFLENFENSQKTGSECSFSNIVYPRTIEANGTLKFRRAGQMYLASGCRRQGANVGQTTTVAPAQIRQHRTHAGSAPRAPSKSEWVKTRIAHLCFKPASHGALLRHRRERALRWWRDRRLRRAILMHTTLELRK